MRNPIYAFTVLFLAFVFAYADRGVIYVLVPAIRDSLGLTLVQVSLLQGFAFAMFFALAGIPLGRLADRSNRRNLLAAGLAFWSLATIACGLSGSFWQLFAARLCVGVGEACLIPAVASLLSDAYPPGKRGRAIALVQVGVPTGSLLAVVAGGWALTWLQAPGTALAPWGLDDWQIIFIALGAPGLLLALVMLGISEPARRESAPSAGPAPPGGVLKLFADKPAGFFAFFLSQALATTLSYVVLAMGPTLYMTAYGLNAGQAGTLTGGTLLVSSVTAYAAGGFVSDALWRRWPETGRIITTMLPLPLAFPALLALFFSRDAAAVTVALSVILFASTFWSSGAAPALQAVSPNRMRGQLVAIMYLGMNILGLGVTPTLVAWVAERRGVDAFDLQWSQGVVGLGVALLGVLLAPVILRSYRSMRKYEVEEYRAGQ